MLARTCVIGLAMVLAGSLSLAGQSAASGAKSGGSARTQWSGIYTEAQAQRGQVLYAENCAYCHGAELEGTLSAPPLTGPVLSARWNGKTLADLFEYQQAFMPWNSPNGFRRPQNADILAYILKKGGFAAGTELSAEHDAQASIRIALAKP